VLAQRREARKLPEAAAALVLAGRLLELLLAAEFHHDVQVLGG
jgi:hypothetical protein